MCLSDICWMIVVYGLFMVSFVNAQLLCVEQKAGSQDTVQC